MRILAGLSLAMDLKVTNGLTTLSDIIKPNKSRGREKLFKICKRVFSLLPETGRLEYLLICSKQRRAIKQGS